MSKPIKVIVTTGYGTNCEMEMAHACRLAGADKVDIVHLSDLLDGSVDLHSYHFLNLPGGFLDGDNLGAAQAGANRIRHATVSNTGKTLFEHILEFIKEGGVILGVCNGFQLMVKSGLLPGIDSNYSKREVSLTWNDSGKFEDRWVTLKIPGMSRCIFTKGIDTIELPIRHGEGKFVTLNKDIISKIKDNNQIAMQYVDDKEEPTDRYPFNPNGSEEAIAGICDPSGRIMGLMPHPEAFTHSTNHPTWTRHKVDESGAGLALFVNAIDYIRSNVV